MAAASEPSASIILPIIDRADTFALAIPRVLAQSRPDFELLVTCSGATPAVRSIAHGYAARDPRVRVLEYPPSPVRTTAARVRAMGEARSDRIFICQDDDLWGPRHVELLCALLDHADIAVTLTAVATLTGTVSAFPCPIDRPDWRAKVAGGQPKTTFEGHVAFRRSGYERVGVAWDTIGRRDCLTTLIRTFCQPNVDARHAFSPVATALSFNAANRLHMSNLARADELARWDEALRKTLLHDLVHEKANLTTVWGRLVGTKQPRSDDRIGPYCKRTFAMAPTEIAHAASLGGDVEDHAKALRRMARLFQGDTGVGNPGALLLDACEPTQPTTWESAALDQLVARGHAPAALAAAVRKAGDDAHTPGRKALAHLCHAHLLLVQDAPVEAEQAYLNAASTAPVLATGAMDLRVRLALALGQRELAFEILNAHRVQRPLKTGLREIATDLAEEFGDADAARDIGAGVTRHTAREALGAKLMGEMT